MTSAPSPNQETQLCLHEDNNAEHIQHTSIQLCVPAWLARLQGSTDLDKHKACAAILSHVRPPQLLKHALMLSEAVCDCLKSLSHNYARFNCSNMWMLTRKDPRLTDSLSGLVCDLDALNGGSGKHNSFAPLFMWRHPSCAACTSRLVVDSSR